ncbi:type VI secretion system baseplate subunit TssF [Endozoicomonadaceae bacterium StTr2]
MLTDNLLFYYEQELNALREGLRRYSHYHPEESSKLGLGDIISDPEMLRLLESIALLNARLEERLDEEYPQLVRSLLELMFPDYLRPLPSFSMLALDISRDARETVTIPRGTRFEVSSGKRERLVFSTCHEVTLKPVKVKQARIQSGPFEFSLPAWAGHGHAILELTLQLPGSDMKFEEINLDQLDFHIPAREPLAALLFDLLMTRALAGCLVSANDKRRLWIKPEDVIHCPVFHSGNSLLPRNQGSFNGFTLLRDFFAFPWAFQSFQICFDNFPVPPQGHEVTLMILLEEAPVELIRSVGAAHFQPACVPVANIQQVVSEPVRIDHTRFLNPIPLPDNRYIYDIVEILDVTDARETRPLPRLLEFNYRHKYKDQYWQFVQLNKGNGLVENAIALSDRNLRPSKDSGRILVTRMYCFDGNQPRQLGSTSSIKCIDPVTFNARPHLLYKPTSARLEAPESQFNWAMLSHFALNFHSLFDPDKGLEALRELLGLYLHEGSIIDASLPDHIISATHTHQVAPVSIEGKRCFAQGTQLTLVLKSEQFHPLPLNLFIELMDALISCYCPYNSFTQLLIRIQGRSEVYRRCPRRLGCRPGI